MSDKKTWKVGYNSETGKFVPVPYFGNMSYKEAKRECKKLNKISKKESEK